MRDSKIILIYEYTKITFSLIVKTTLFSQIMCLSGVTPDSTQFVTHDTFSYICGHQLDIKHYFVEYYYFNQPNIQKKGEFYEVTAKFIRKEQKAT